MTQTLLARAKLNLHLDIAGRLPNGYHSVAMLMQSISLADTITVGTTETPGIQLVCGALGVPADSRNTAWKAAEALIAWDAADESVRSYFARHGLRIAIEKRIPAGAGLAGGSADAAAVLRALRDMFLPETPLPALLPVAANVGADVPFCLLGGCCWAEGIGELLTPVPGLPQEYRVALVKPGISVHTGSAYAKLDQITLRRPETALVKQAALRGDWPAALPHCANVFEQAVVIPGLAEAKALCGAAGAALTQMTGSGSAVFSLCGRGADETAVEAALAALGGVVRWYTPERGGTAYH